MYSQTSLKGLPKGTHLIVIVKHTSSIKWLVFNLMGGGGGLVHTKSVNLIFASLHSRGLLLEEFST